MMGLSLMKRRTEITREGTPGCPSVHLHRHDTGGEITSIGWRRARLSTPLNSDSFCTRTRICLSLVLSAGRAFTVCRVVSDFAYRHT